MARKRLTNILLIRREAKIINRKEKLAIVVRHEDFPNIELYETQWYINIDEEGPEWKLFRDASNDDEAEVRAGGDGEEDFVPYDLM